MNLSGFVVGFSYFLYTVCHVIFTLSVIGEPPTPANFDKTAKPRSHDAWEGELYENGSFYMGRRHNVFKSSYQVMK